MKNLKPLGAVNLKYQFLILFILLLSCGENQSNSEYEMVYKNDKDGKTLVGSKQKLIQAIRGGASIRIGWGWKGEKHSIEHVSDPIWIAILDEQEVIAHLDAQVLSKTNWTTLTASYEDSTLLNREWRVVLSTKGEFDAVWYDRKKGELLQRRPQNHIISWFVKDEVENASPLFEEKSP